MEVNADLNDDNINVGIDNGGNQLGQQQNDEVQEGLIRQRQPQHHGNNEHIRHIMNTIPWIKLSIVVILMFVSAMLQVTVWTLEIAVTQTRYEYKVLNQKRLDEEEQKPPQISSKQDVGYDETTEYNEKEDTLSSTTILDNNYKNNNENFPQDDNTGTTSVTTEPTTISETKDKDETKQQLVPPLRGITPVELDTIHWHRLKSTTTTTRTASSGTSVQTSANAYWHQVLQSGLFSWECYDSLPSVGSSIYLFTMTKSHCQQIYNKRAAQSSHNQGTGSSSSSNKLKHKITKFLTTGTFIFPTKTSIKTNITGHDIHKHGKGKKVKKKKRIQYGLYALQKAAELGHPEAQHLIANALSAGFYPYVIGTGQKQKTQLLPLRSSSSSSSSTTTSSVLSDDRNMRYPSIFLQSANLSSFATKYNGKDHSVSEDWLLHSKNPIHTKAMLLWHMAAQHGNVDAAIAIANRILADQAARPPKNQSPTIDDRKTTSTTIALGASDEQRCRVRLPYYAAAAHAIIDQLEASDQSRAIVLPARDRHILYKIHLHGSTHSKLLPHNQPDERHETIEFYKIKASEIVEEDAQSRTSSSSSFSSSTSSVGASHGDATKEARDTALMLGRFYQFGGKGIMQNMTLALKYYVAAAKAGSWEAAGHAGTFYLWGIGVKQNYTLAYDMFRRGAPFGYDGCHEKFQRRLIQNQMKINRKKDPKQLLGMDTSILDEKIDYCDDIALNGMGLLRLFRVHPHTNLVSLDQNEEIAVNLFRLSQAQGNADASYNLAMIRLGYKSHIKSIHDIDSSKTTSTLNDDIYPLLKSSTSNSVSNSNDEKKIQGVDVTSSDSSTSKDKGTQAFDKKSRHFPTATEYKTILTELTTASDKMHIHATHRLAMIYEHGIQVPSSTTRSKSLTTTTASMNSKSKRNLSTMQTVVAKDCIKAEKNYKWIIDYASPQINTRMRLAYKMYMSGNTADSLRHYLAVAEMGHATAQVNAAFLLDHGECLNGLLSPSQCSSASVRLWKAAALKGDDPEASIRVGDYYYYGKFRHGQVQSTQPQQKGRNGRRPFLWVQHILFPEEYVVPFLYSMSVDLIETARSIVSGIFFKRINNHSNEPDSTVADDEFQSRSKYNLVCTETTDGTQQCTSKSLYSTTTDKRDHGSSSLDKLVEQDLVAAARYYKLAADQASGGSIPSPRAHYNLGFMYEWGLGLKQDFPLAKRHYDLAVQSARLIQEANLPVLLALHALTFHEYLVKQRLLWYNRIERWQQRRRRTVAGDGTIARDDTANVNDVSNSVDGIDATTSPTRSTSVDEPLQYRSTTIRDGKKVSMQPATQQPRRRTHLHDDMIIQTGNPVVDVILYHILSWETLLIIVLTLAVTVLVQIRYAQQQRRQ